MLSSIPLEQLGHLAALACAFTWAVATLMFGQAAQTQDARALNLLKCAVSTVLLGLAATVVAVVTGEVPTFSARDSLALFVSAILGLVFADTAYFMALKHLGAARAVTFVSLVPVCTALAAIPVLDEELTSKMVAGMALALLGVTIVVKSRATAPVSESVEKRTRASRSTTIGVLGGVVYCVTQAGANVLTKGTDPSLSALSLSFARLAVGAAVLAVMLVSTSRGRSHIAALRPVAMRATVATFIGTFVGLVLGTFALRTVSAGVATTLIATTPLFAMVLARLFGERPSGRALLGACLALLGVALLVL